MSIIVILFFSNPFGEHRERELTYPQIRVFTVKKTEVQRTVDSQGALNEQIQGKTFKDAVEIPRVALHNENQVLIVKNDETLHLTKIEILYVNKETVVVGQGLANGDKICISPIESVVDGMSVRIIE